MKRTLLLILLSCSVRLAAQPTPKVFVSVGRNLFDLHQSELWKLDLNAGAYGGYSVWPGVMVIAYFDYNRYSFTGYYQGTIYYSANRGTFSVLTGVKLSTIIPKNPVSPYFMGALGLSNTTSSRDSIFNYSGTSGVPLIFKVGSGNTLSFLAAVGADIRIYQRFAVFFELRTSAGFDSNIYDILWMYRAGIGIAIS